ncbi:MAG: hypothetical protein QW412_02105 [Candidatus Aenigmatarchaeota archaeon]
MFKRLLALILVGIFLKEAVATRGIGIAPAENNVTLSPGQEYIFYLILFNPSDKDANVSLRFYCLNCFRDFNFLGLRGKVNITQKFIEIPNEIEVEKNTSHLEGKFVEVKLKIPYFFEEQLTLENKTIPWFGFSSSLEELNFNVIASTGDVTQVSVVSRLGVKVKSQFPFILIPIIFLIILLLIKILRRR